MNRPCPLPHGAWDPIPAFWDEFGGDGLDAAKWHPNNPGWLGREPGYFNPQNVRVREGMLHLDAKREDLPGVPPRYHTFTTAAVKSRNTVRYGYFEIRARAMDARASSAFWFYDGSPEQWTEIDVFEIGARRYPNRYFMNTHVFHTLVETTHWDKSQIWEAPYNLSQEFHVYGLEWDRDQIAFWIDGQVVRREANTHWHQALTLNFDSETFPDWFGLPEAGELPATFSIDYVRAWRRRDGPPDDKPLTVEFRFPGRQAGADESRFRLPAQEGGVLAIRAKGGDERPAKVLLELDDEAFFAAQTGDTVRRRVTVRDRAGKELGLDLAWTRQPRKGGDGTSLKAATPHGYHPCGVDVVPAARPAAAAAEEYRFQAEGGAEVRVTVRYP